jgi:hypothetical protein
MYNFNTFDEFSSSLNSFLSRRQFLLMAAMASVFSFEVMLNKWIYIGKAWIVYSLKQEGPLWTN